MNVKHNIFGGNMNLTELKARKIKGIVSELSENISDLIGSSVKFSYELKKNGFEKNYLSVRSSNMVHHFGLFEGIADSVTVETFNSSYNEETSTIWMTLHYSWKFKNGGSNGHEIATCWYCLEKGKEGWVIKNEMIPLY